MMLRKMFATLALLCISAGSTQADGVVLKRLPTASSSAEIKSLSFNGDESQVIGNLTDGKIYTWSLDGTNPLLIAQTEQAFAYCPAGERMVISAGEAAVLLSLRDGGYSALSEGFYDHANFSADCNTMVLAEAGANTIEYWQISEQPVLRNATSLAAVQNGLKLSADGRTFAAATAPDLEDPSVDTAIEVFTLTDNNTLRRLVLLQEPETVIGLDGLGLTNDGIVIAATRNGETSGLLAANGRTESVSWSWTGFPTEQVQAVEISSDNLSVLSADTGGNVVI